MSKCSPLTPLRRDGTSQRQRMPAALDPCAAPIDGRSTADLLLYAGDLARLLQYYTEQNTPKGDWSPFIEHDVSTLAARVGTYDASASQEEFESLLGGARVEAAFPAAFAGLVAAVFALAQKFEEWRRGSLEGLPLRARLDRVIEGALADALRGTIRAAKRANGIDPHVALPAFESLGGAWGNLVPHEDASLFPSGAFTIDTERAAAVKVVAASFERFHDAAMRLAADARGFFADTLARYPQHRPHAALFLAFLRLFNHARHALNALTDAHLDFYYREVLQLVPRGPVADRVHVLFELAKNLPPCRVPEDRLLNAGKDAAGLPLEYGTDSEIVVNHASLHPDHGLKTVFVDIEPPPAGVESPPEIVRNVHAAGDADSDAIAPPVNGEKRWPTFGNTTLPYARIGFAVASPMLWLAEGKRKVTISFQLASPDFLAGKSTAAVQLELTHNAVIEATGPKGWIATTSTATISGGNRVDYTFELGISDPPVVGFDPAIHLEAFDTKLPVLRFVLKNDGLPAALLVPSPPTSIADYSDDTPSFIADTLVRFEGRTYRAKEAIPSGVRPRMLPDTSSPWELIDTCAYKYFERMRVQSVTITADVKEMRNVIVENDAGPLKPAKPFAPFSHVPHAGSSLLIGSREIFQKTLKTLTVTLKWVGLPQVAFGQYYGQYVGSIPQNSNFTVAVEILKDAEWVDGGVTAAVQYVTDGPWVSFTPPAVPLFGAADAAAPLAVQPVKLTFGATAFPRDSTLGPIRRFQPSLDRGFVRLRLNGTFLHERYAIALATYSNLLARYSVLLTEYVKAGSVGQAPTPPTPPNPPYTPMVAGLKADYVAEETINYSSYTREKLEDRIERLFHVGPFGHQEFAPVPPVSAIPGVEPATSPVPAFTVKGDDVSSGIAEGTLYLGVAHLTPPQNVSFLFQVAEGSEDPALPAQDVQWSYLTASGWKDFAFTEILLDTTNELIASGIVRFAIPATATNAATILPAQLHWLRATVRRKSGAIPRAVAVLPQAVVASFRDHGNDVHHLEHPLPAGTIAKLVEREAAIKSVAQPFSSFGGRMAERDDAFRVRVAERLRHKRRAITIFDYERLVLERFPEVYKVRCLCHTGAESEYAPGSVRIVVVPNLRNRNAIDPLRPRLSLSRLEEIRHDLAEMATDFADVQVVNPDYEEVRVRLDVRFRTGFDKRFYTGQLERDIIRFLSPWLYDEGVDLAFGGRVHRSAILNFVEEREYVDFAANFTIDHIIPGATAHATRTRVDVEEAEPTKSSAVIVPAATHHVGDAIVSCVDSHGRGAG